ncbi:hypothetical protein BJX61DRAFT_65557 [Aspergillus egyptiacus]|nr:hypothetical protein BJX61DRAFT_65557 [Aspergillus egyptiacus]
MQILTALSPTCRRVTSLNSTTVPRQVALPGSESRLADSSRACIMNIVTLPGLSSEPDILCPSEPQADWSSTLTSFWTPYYLNHIQSNQFISQQNNSPRLASCRHSNPAVWGEQKPPRCTLDEVVLSWYAVLKALQNHNIPLVGSELETRFTVPNETSSSSSSCQLKLFHIQLDMMPLLTPLVSHLRPTTRHQL